MTRQEAAERIAAERYYWWRVYAAALGGLMMVKYQDALFSSVDQAEMAADNADAAIAEARKRGRL